MSVIMTVIARWLMLALFYLIAVPVCILILIFWVVRLVITVVLMVFALVFEAWRRKAVSRRPYQIIENVAKVGPETVKTVLTAPFREDSDEQDYQVGVLVFEVGYAVLFLIAFALIFVFEGFLYAFGQALSAPANIYSQSGVGTLLAFLYVVASLIAAAYMILRGHLNNGPFRELFLPAYLFLTGVMLVILLWRAASIAAA
jgi:hypothetical protein